MKLLFENWRKFLTEDEDATGAMPSHLDSKVKTQADKDALDKMGYLVLKELGRGKFGVVYLVENKQSQQRLAAKVVKESDRETSNYQFAMDNKASMPEEYGKYLPEIYEREVGSTIFTSGKDGIFPSGIPVGTTLSEEEFYSAQLLADPTQLSLVNVILKESKFKRTDIE